jgi:hypothetical protein
VGQHAGAQAKDQPSLPSLFPLKQLINVCLCVEFML